MHLDFSNFFNISKVFVFNSSFKVKLYLIVCFIHMGIYITLCFTLGYVYFFMFVCFIS